MNHHCILLLAMIAGFVTGCQSTNQSTDIAPASTELHVSEGGYDGWNGTVARPYRSLARAVHEARPGCTIFVHNGTYRESVSLIRSGRPDAYITIRNFPGDVPVFDGGWTWTKGQKPDAPGLDNAINITYKTRDDPDIGYVRIEGLVMRHYKRAGIDLGWYPKEPEVGYLCKTRHIEVRYCIADECGQKGISASYCENVVAENNITCRTGDFEGYDSWASGINFIYMRGRENVIRGNVSFHNIDIVGIPGRNPPWYTDGNGAIVDTSGNEGSFLVENNLFFMNGGAGFVVTRSSNVVIRNNTAYNNVRKNPKGNSFDFSGDESYVNITLNQNLGWQPDNSTANGADKPFLGGYQKDNWFEGDPGFLDAGKADFRIHPSRAPSGTSPASEFDIGFDAKAITMDDMTQRKSFWIFAPDYHYIESKGGLSECFRPRPRGAKPTPGAYQVEEH